MSKKALDTYVNTAQNYFGNCGSPHAIGRESKQLLDFCRTRMAELTNVPKNSLIFTSGGTESNHLAIRLSCRLLTKTEVLVSPFEHASVFHVLSGVPGIRIRKIDITNSQRITPQILLEQIRPETGLIIVQQVNSVTGAIQPIDELASALKEQYPDILFHSDCAQSFGKIPLPQQISSWSAAGHKVYGPKGSGLLFLNPAFPFSPLLTGTNQERGFRGGTQDVPAIASFTAAAEDSFQHASEEFQRLSELQQLLLETLNWEPLDLPDSFPGITGLFSNQEAAVMIVQKLSDQEIYVSATAACNIHEVIDPVLLALNVPFEKAKRYLRISFGKDTKTEDVLILAKALKAADQV